MKRILNPAELERLCDAGAGFVYNDFARSGTSTRWNRLHRAGCNWLAQSKPSVAKLWFEDLESAIAWLGANRGKDGTRLEAVRHSPSSQSRHA